MLLFVDESGHDRRESPYEILAGVAIKEQDLWNLIQAIQNLEIEIFGVRLANVGVEMKGKKLLKKRIFEHAKQHDPLAPDLHRATCLEFLQKGYRESQGGEREFRTRQEFAAYGQAALEFIHRLYGLCADYRLRAIAAIVETKAPRPEGDFLRKDYAYLFERFFYYLEDTSPNEMGIVVFDEIEKSLNKTLINQMERYFSGTARGRIRSARIIPQPFFVHSDLTTAIQISDILAYSLNWGFRLNKMRRPTRPELEEFGQFAFELKYTGQRVNETDGQVWPVYGIFIWMICDRNKNAPSPLKNQKAEMVAHQSLRIHHTTFRRSMSSKFRQIGST